MALSDEGTKLRQYFEANPDSDTQADAEGELFTAASWCYVDYVSSPNATSFNLLANIGTDKRSNGSSYWNVFSFSSCE